MDIEKLLIRLSVSSGETVRLNSDPSNINILSSSLVRYTFTLSEPLLVWPQDAVNASEMAYNSRGLLSYLSNFGSFNRFCKSTVLEMPPPILDNKNTKHNIIECFVTQQGPNYAPT